jgi:hypothetical protein
MKACTGRLPKRNVFWANIKPGTPITLCGKPGTRYYVAGTGRNRALPYWEGQNAREAQRRLDAAVKRGSW